jgi:hypothetical protein
MLLAGRSSSRRPVPHLRGSHHEASELLEAPPGLLVAPHASVGDSDRSLVPGRVQRRLLDSLDSGLAQQEGDVQVLLDGVGQALEGLIECALRRGTEERVEH